MARPLIPGGGHPQAGPPKRASFRVEGEAMAALWRVSKETGVSQLKLMENWILRATEEYDAQKDGVSP